MPAIALYCTVQYQLLVRALNSMFMWSSVGYSLATGGTYSFTPSHQMDCDSFSTQTSEPLLRMRWIISERMRELWGGSTREPDNRVVHRPPTRWNDSKTYRSGERMLTWRITMHEQQPEQHSAAVWLIMKTPIFTSAIMHIRVYRICAYERDACHRIIHRRLPSPPMKLKMSSSRSQSCGCNNTPLQHKNRTGKEFSAGEPSSTLNKPLLLSLATHNTSCTTIIYCR